MDNGLNMKKIKEAVVAWIAERRDQLGSIPLSFRDTSDSSVTLEANSRLLQIVIPSSFQMLDCDSAGQISYEEVFLVTSLDDKSDEIFDNTITALNEKLERIHIRRDSLGRVLDCLLKALLNFELKRDEGLKHNGFSSCSERKRTGSRVQTPAEDRAIQIGVSDDDQESLGDESDTAGSEGEATLEDYGYDLASGEYGKRASEKGDLASGEYGKRAPEKGFLYATAEDAKRQCEITRETSDWLFLDSTTLDVKSCNGILRWCDVNPDSESLNVHLLMQIGGLVRDDSAACALGFTLDSPMELSLQFNKKLWSQVEYNPMSCPLKPEKWHVTQERYTGRRVTADDFYEETRKLRKVDQTHLYGPEVLLPDLFCTYFDFLINKTLSTAKMENPDLLSELQQCSAMNNPFIGLLCFLSARLRALPAWCFVCWNPLPYSVCRLRTCDKELCLFQFEELGLGTHVLQEVQKCPELIDFELSLALAAAHSGRDVFEPFPEFLLEEQELRGRCGWFSKLNSSGKSAMTAKTASKLQRKVPNRHIAAGGADPSLKNKNIMLLRSLLHSYPSIEVMKDCPDEVTLMKKLTKLWRKTFEQEEQNQRAIRLEDQNGSSQWTEKLWLPYDVLRFVLSTSRLSLYLLKDDEKLYSDAHYQFAVLHDSPEREAHFERRRIEQGGSFFAFHGSSADNWFSILRNGLRCLSNTVYMSNGAACGTGIYLSNNMATSMGYCSFKGPGWDHGSLKRGFSVLAICEVINGSIRRPQGILNPNTASLHSRPSQRVSNQMPTPYDIMVVPPEHEKDVAIRYMLIFAEQQGNPRKYHVIGRALVSNNMDLMQHYQHLRSMYPVKQENRQQEQKEARWQSMLVLLKGERGPNDDGTVGDSQAIPLHPPGKPF